MAAMAQVVTVRLAHPLPARSAASLGIAVREYQPDEDVTVPVPAARRLISAGLTTINPYDRVAVNAALAEPGVSGPSPDWLPVYIGPDEPPDDGRYGAWWQTGLGPDGTGVTLWIEDGT
jgi:hypothetical protein